jgi:hypothetical protein
VRALDNFYKKRDAAAAAAAPAKKAAVAAKVAEARAARRALQDEQRRAHQRERRVQEAAYAELLPHGVEERNKSFYSRANWAMEDVKWCSRCGKPEPKKGCWCM